MRKRRDELREISREDQGKINALDQKAQGFVDSRTLEMRERYQKIIAQIQALKDEKDELLRAPNTKEDAIKFAKERLRAQRKHFTKYVLGAHLKDCQTGRTYPFNDMAFKVNIFDPEKCWKLAFFAITEKDIDEAASELQDIGIPDDEREAKISEIERKIAELGKQINEKL